MPRSPPGSASGSAGSRSGWPRPLMTARAYWPSEPDLTRRGRQRARSGSSPCWSSPGWPSPSALVGGTLRFRWSWADAGGHRPDAPGRPQRVARARSPAGDQPGLGVGRVGARIPARCATCRGPGASRPRWPAPGRDGGGRRGLRALSGRRRAARSSSELLQATPMEALRHASGSTPGTPAQAPSRTGCSARTSRGPRSRWPTRWPASWSGRWCVMLAVAWENLVSTAASDGTSRGSAVLALAAVPTLAVLVCLILTKSRSAYIGLAVGAGGAGLARAAAGPPADAAAGVAGVGLVVVAALVAGGAGDRPARPPGAHRVGQVAALSLGILGRRLAGDHRAAPRTFWTGSGRATSARLRPVQAARRRARRSTTRTTSLLEVWATAGVWAAVALVSALGLAVWNLLGPASPCGAATVDDAFSRPPQPSPRAARPPGRRAGSWPPRRRAGCWPRSWAG